MSEPKNQMSIAGRMFAGQRLEPLTKQREVVACDLGLRFGFTTKYRPQYFLRDTIIVLWLCSIPVAAEATKDNSDPWSVNRAEWDPDGAIKEAYQFAQRRGIGIDTPAFSEAYAIFIALMKEVQESRGEPIIPEDEKKTTEQNDSEL